MAGQSGRIGVPLPDHLRHAAEPAARGAAEHRGHAATLLRGAVVPSSGEAQEAADTGTRRAAAETAPDPMLKVFPFEWGTPLVEGLLLRAEGIFWVVPGELALLGGEWSVGQADGAGEDAAH